MLCHAFPHCADRSPAFHHRGAGRKCGRVNGVELGNPFKIAFAEQFHPFCIHRFNLGFLSDGRCDQSTKNAITSAILRITNSIYFNSEYE